MRVTVKGEGITPFTTDAPRVEAAINDWCLKYYRSDVLGSKFEVEASANRGAFVTYSVEVIPVPSFNIALVETGRVDYRPVRPLARPPQVAPPVPVDSEAMSENPLPQVETPPVVVHQPAAPLSPVPPFQHPSPAFPASRRVFSKAGPNTPPPTLPPNS